MVKLKKAIDILNQEWAQLSQEMYSKPSDDGSQPNESSNPSKDKKDDNIEDADFEVVDEK